MLGRGLEALIPPQGNGSRQAYTEPELQASQGYPLPELSSEPREELLGASAAPVPLMLHVHDEEPSGSPYVQPQAPSQPSYADMRPESQGDSFSAQQYRYDVVQSQPSAQAQQAPADYAAMRPESQGDAFSSHAYRYEAPAAQPGQWQAETTAPAQAFQQPAPAQPSYADMRPESQGDSFSAQPYRYEAPSVPAQPAAAAYQPPAQQPQPAPARASVPQDIYDDVRQPHEAVFQIDIDRIHPNPHQPRKTFDDAALADLASSIREFGILQPLVVRKVEHETPKGTEVRYELIAGERRWRASRLVGLPRVPAIVRADVANKESLELAIIENLQREQLNAIEMARAYARLQDEFNMTQREVATRLGKSRETVANTLRLLDLPGDVQAAIEDGRISESHGRLLLGVTDPALQQSLFKDLLERQLTTRELRERVAAGKGRRVGPRTPRDTQPLSPELQMLQERLASELGAPVRIQATGDTGKITISFYSREELSAILERLAAEADILL